jgi:hypothetical protein
MRALSSRSVQCGMNKNVTNLPISPPKCEVLCLEYTTCTYVLPLVYVNTSFDLLFKTAETASYA